MIEASRARDIEELARVVGDNLRQESRVREEATEVLAKAKQSAAQKWKSAKRCRERAEAATRELKRLLIEGDF